MKVTLKRVKWLNGYAGPSRWAAEHGAEEYGFLALHTAGLEAGAIGYGITASGGDFETMDEKYAHGCFGHLVYRLPRNNCRLFIIGCGGVITNRNPLFEIIGLNARREHGCTALKVAA